MMNQAVIGLGSNIDPDINITSAKRLLSQKFKVLKKSQFITTKPIGKTDQPNFVNGAVLLETPLPQPKLKEELKNIEIALGRKRTDEKFGPRTIDLDILVWNNAVIDQDFYKRTFLRQTVLELLPDIKY